MSTSNQRGSFRFTTFPVRGKTSRLRYVWGMDIWRFFIYHGIRIDAPNFHELYTLSSTHNPSYDFRACFNPFTSFGRAILHHTSYDLRGYFVHCLYERTLYLAACITRVRILPLIARKRRFKKNHFNHLKISLPPPSSPITLINSSTFKPRIRTVNEVKTLLWKTIKIQKLPFNTARTESKPREGVG